jgi:hypothetical protein
MGKMKSPAWGSSSDIVTTPSVAPYGGWWEPHTGLQLGGYSTNAHEVNGVVLTVFQGILLL